MQMYRIQELGEKPNASVGNSIVEKGVLELGASLQVKPGPRCQVWAVGNVGWTLCSAGCAG